MPLRSRIQSAARRQPLVLIAMGVVLYSTGPVLLQAASLSGPAFSFWRLWLGVPVLGVAAALQVRAGGRWPSWEGWRWALWAGLAFAVHQVLFMTSVKWTSVTDVSLMNTLAPIVTAVGAAPLFGERPGVRFRLWTIVAITGAMLVILGASAGPQGSPLGMAMAAGNVVFFAVFFLLSKKARDYLDVLPFLVGVMAIAAVAVSAFVWTVGIPVSGASAQDLLLAGIVAAGPGALGHFIMTWPLRWVAANIPPVMRLAQPIYAGLMAWWFLGEPVTRAHLFGGALTIAGVCGAVLSPSARLLAADEPVRPAHRAQKASASAR